MKTPSDCIGILYKKIKKEWKISFLSAFFLGILIHLPAFIQDVPNHDGLASMYFDQNMITSGRWFLTVACGISSYFTIPWIIGLLSLLWISITCVIITETLEVKQKEWIFIISALVVSFPSLASTYAYVFTADGYMFALFLAVLAVYLTKNNKWGMLAGGICLAFSMGTYQAYLPFCMILCFYVCIQHYLKTSSNSEKGNKLLKVNTCYTMRFVAMGVLGISVYYIILQVLLKVEGKVLDTYQGIDGMASIGGTNIFNTIGKMYQDFFAFLFQGKIFFNNAFSLIAVVLLVFLLVITLIKSIRVRKLYKNIWFWIIFFFFVLTLPLMTNIILFISPQVGYHLLMRYQYVLLLILLVSFISQYNEKAISQWILLVSCVVIFFNFAVSVNIGYSNLQKRYEKTYAYCLRLADRMEQTEGYYTGMPVVMMGVVGDENFPQTDITTEVTGNMIGLCGDYLCYTGKNFKEFFKHYLGITIEVVEQEIVGEIYSTSEIYQALDSFPGPHCMEVVDGVLYVKTENVPEVY